jgi:hypothetical protein
MEVPGHPAFSPALSCAPKRLDAVDFFRGLALTFVLVNHLDWSVDRKLFRLFTPVGLGFSDGAEAFVFLSGLTFGWVYINRLQRDGLWRSAAKVLRRVIQIYAGYVVCLLLLVALSRAPIPMTEWSRNPLRIDSDAAFIPALVRSLTLQQFPFALGILGLYIAILPAMLFLLALARRSVWPVLAISVALYAIIQPPLGWEQLRPAWLARWLFQPLAWQLMFVLGMLIGARLRRGQFASPRNPFLLALAGAVVLHGLVSAKRGFLAAASGWSDPDFWEWFNLSNSWLVAKPTLGPLRIVHFAAVAWLIGCWLPKTADWNAVWTRPFINTGRHSLTLYCCGTLLVYASAIPLYRFGNGTIVVAILGLDACLLQFAIAWWLERRKRSKGLEEQRSRGKVL